MRLILLGMAAVISLSAPAQAEWKQYKDASLGIYSYFPSEPVKTVTKHKPSVRNALGKEAPAVVLTAMDSGVTYRVEVVDYSGQIRDSANIMQEALNDATSGRGTSFTVTDFPRWDLGTNSVYGTALIIEKADKDHTHILEDVVFNKGKLYLISASVPGDSPSRNSPGLARFIDSSQFYLNGYGEDFATGHDYPLGDDDPRNRDNRPAGADYKRLPGLVNGPLDDVK